MKFSNAKQDFLSNVNLKKAQVYFCTWNYYKDEW